MRTQITQEKLNSKTEWKAIQDFPNYAISDSGIVWSWKSKKYLSIYDNGYGYDKVILCNDSTTKTIKNHILVGKAFVHNPHPELNNELNHLDLNKKNNHKSNLEWCTRRENLHHYLYTSGKWKVPTHNSLVKIKNLSWSN